MQVGDTVDEFTLSTAHGDEMTFEDDGELLIVFRFADPARCRDQADAEDGALQAWADDMGLGYWHVLVGGDEQAALAFAQGHALDGDCVLYDPDGAVAVEALGADAQRCWLMIHGDAVHYHGPAELEALRAAAGMD